MAEPLERRLVLPGGLHARPAAALARAVAGLDASVEVSAGGAFVAAASPLHLMRLRLPPGGTLTLRASGPAAAAALEAATVALREPMP